MWKVYGQLVHVLILASISLIYFRTTLEKDLQPQRTMRDLGLEPPADRLVVFLTDGYRAASFFAKNCSTVPHLQEIFTKQGMVGISRTCLPTQSRPGHIAVFGGFHEDPSSALTNFKKNPTEFDTVFNRSRTAYGWGAYYIVNIFSNLPNGGRPLNFEMYTSSDFSGSCQTDAWVFNKVRHFLASDEVERLREISPVVFFVYLGDIDVAGHVYKPDSQIFLEKLNFTETGIKEMYDLFERTFPDKRTTYLMTADHGMSDYGSHGSGSDVEIEVPFIFWGAGIGRQAPNVKLTFIANSDGLEMPLHELDQTQLAPLMSALIGLPPPMHNMAILPRGFMNVSEKYEAHAIHINTLQLLEQVERVLKRHSRGFFSEYLHRFEALDLTRIRHYKALNSELLLNCCYADAMRNSHSIAKLALECLNFYRDYYQNSLIVTTIITYLGWIFFLTAKQARTSGEEKQGFTSFSMLLLCVACFVIVVLIVLQRVSVWIGVFLLLPLPIWLLAIRERGVHSPICVIPVFQLVWVVSCAGLLIFTFNERRLISLGYIFAVCANNRRCFSHPSMKFFVWLFLVCALATFPLLIPNLGYHHEWVLYASMLVTLLRPLLANHRHSWYTWLPNVGILVMGAFCVYQRSHNVSVHFLVHVGAWIYLFYSFMSILCIGGSTAEQRIELILFNLSTLYTLLCSSYEAIFVNMLCTEYILGQQILRANKHREADDMDSKLLTPQQHLYRSYQYASLILLYTYFSFFGTGNVFSVNSFDPNTARVFVTNYSMFLIGSMIMLKLFIPAIIILCATFAYSNYARRNTRHINICLFIIGDVMSMYFFIFMRNRGTWREVRNSISNLFIVHVSTMILVFLTFISKLLLSAKPKTMLPNFKWTGLELESTGSSQA